MNNRPLALIGLTALCAIVALGWFYGCQSSSKDHLTSLDRDINTLLRQTGPCVVAVRSFPSDTAFLGDEPIAGSGVVVRPGIVLTSADNVENCDSTWVMTYRGDTLKAKEVRFDHETNIAYLVISDRNLPTAKIFQDTLNIDGRLGFCIGKSEYSIGLAPTMGTLARSWIGGVDYLDGDLLLFSGPTAPGYSGCPIFDATGNLVGVIEGMLEGNSSVHLVLPAHSALTVVDRLVADGKVPRGWMGVFSGVGCYNESPAERDAKTAARVTGVVAGSPAEKAGLKPGDMILSLGGKPIESPARLRADLTRTAPGTHITLELLRNNTKVTVSMDLGQVPQDPRRMRRCASRSL